MAGPYLAFARYFVPGDASRLPTVEAFVRRDSSAAWNDHLLVEMGAALAVAGRTDAARATRRAYEARVPPAIRWRDAYLLDALQAFLDLSEGKADAGLAALSTEHGTRRPPPRPWTACWASPTSISGAPTRPSPPSSDTSRLRGRCAGNYDVIFTDPMLLAPIHECLARLYEHRGDRDAAARHAARFLEIWVRTDAVVDPRTAAMRRLVNQVAHERTVGS